ncbi:unnamed protein product [Euphydryas editha]|uniref:Transposase n=1 Tax=Euphydryas editha TaxID=104508 RepID=A0AAU9UMW5_EUPED|nr:unnamed protein product [Euphydryas editha]
MKVTEVYENWQQWRFSQDGIVLSMSTVVDYYSYCREIAEVISSHSDLILGGNDKTVQIDETFLTKSKYHRGRITEQMTITVLGLYCKEDKMGLFFDAKQYHGVNRMFSLDTVHLQTNHSKGEFVSKSDAANIINDLENQNKLMKKSIACRSSDKLLHQNMALYFYRRHYLENNYTDKGSQIMQFLLDTKKVYPGVVNGKLQEELLLKEIDQPEPLVEDEASTSGLPPPKKPRLEGIVTEIDDIDLAIEEASSEVDYQSDDAFGF